MDAEGWTWSWEYLPMRKPVRTGTRHERMWCFLPGEKDSTQTYYRPKDLLLSKSEVYWTSFDVHVGRR